MDAKGREGGGWGRRVCTNLDADEGYLISIFGDDKRASWVLVVQYGSELEDRKSVV